jgi:hypothetical protein
VQKPLADYVPLRELWDGFNPLGVREGTFVVYRGYMDESCRQGQTLFTFSCLIASGKSWFEMERAWRLCIDAKNRQLKKEGRELLRRYHASDCNARRKDFEGWTPEEQIAFVKGLLRTFKRTKGVHAVGYVLNLDELCEVFPDTADRLDAAYFVLTKFIMYTIGDDFLNLGGGKPAKLTLFHDRTAKVKYDETILRAFSQQIADNNFKYAQYFTTVAPLGWEDCIALQPADLVAFETGKYAEQKSKKRKSFEALLDLPQFGIHVKMFTKEILQEMRDHMESLKAVS